MKRKLINKIKAVDFKNLPGWYMGTENAPTFRCPECKGSGDLTAHTIDDNGEVNASVLCHCGKYHEFITLKDWKKLTKP